MKLEDILSVEGIVIRKIPSEIVSHWATSDKAVQNHKQNGGEIFTNDKGRELIVERKKPEIGGKYLVSFAYNTDSLVRFDLKLCGTGETIESAYADFLTKQK